VINTSNSYSYINPIDEGDSVNEYPQVLSASTIIGDKVLNTAGEQLGNIKELMIDPDDGFIIYAVLSFGGFLGMGDKLFAIPWEALTLDTENHAFILEVDKEVLKNAPGFDKDHWPDNAQYEAGWLLNIYEYYGYPPYWMPDEQEENQE
jgi:sporulation protein YlmC with PRC-barrel domain